MINWLYMLPISCSSVILSTIIYKFFSSDESQKSGTDAIEEETDKSTAVAAAATTSDESQKVPPSVPVENGVTSADESSLSSEHSGENGIKVEKMETSETPNGPQPNSDSLPKTNGIANGGPTVGLLGMELLEPSQRHQLKHRELFLSRQIETLPATHIRGKCSVTLLNETETPDNYLSKDVSIWQSFFQQFILCLLHWYRMSSSTLLSTILSRKLF